VALALAANALALAHTLIPFQAGSGGGKGRGVGRVGPAVGEGEESGDETGEGKGGGRRRRVEGRKGP
jgi:hypothetical protein